MKGKSFIVMLLCLLTSLSAGAQEAREQVELVLVEGNTAIFSSEGHSNNKEAAVDNSCQTVLRRLLYQGVPGFNGGEAIVSSGQGSNLWLQGFFTGKYPAYKTFVTGVELLGDFGTSPAGETYCKTHVLIDFGKLLYQCRTQGLMEEPGTQPVQQPSPVQQRKQRPKRSFL